MTVLRKDDFLQSETHVGSMIATCESVISEFMHNISNFLFVSICVRFLCI